VRYLHWTLKHKEKKEYRGPIVKWLRHNVFIITYEGSKPSGAIMINIDIKKNILLRIDVIVT
jgi:hypothetical protein